MMATGKQTYMLQVQALMHDMGTTQTSISRETGIHKVRLNRWLLQPKYELTAAEYQALDKYLTQRGYDSPVLALSWLVNGHYN